MSNGHPRSHEDRDGTHESIAFMLHDKLVVVDIEAPDPASGGTTAIVTATVKGACDNKVLMQETPLELSAFTDDDLLTLDVALTWQNETKGTLVAQAGGVAQVITNKYGVFSCELDWGAGPGARTAYVAAAGRIGGPVVGDAGKQDIEWTP